MSTDLIGTPRYRVWCLSWNDDETSGSDIVAYNLLTHGFRNNDRGVVYVLDMTLYDAADAAEAYASYAHNNRDGYESSWPLKFRVRCPNGSIRDFEVDRETVPEFKARPLKQDAPIAQETAGHQTRPEDVI